MKKRILLAILSLCAINLLVASDNTHIVVIPGQNGLGGNDYYMEKIFSEYAPSLHLLINEEKIHYCATPGLFPDLGQKRCQNDLKTTLLPLLENPNVEKIIFHASSQGSATALNYLANNHHDKIKAVIIEAAMASGNSAISYNLKTESLFSYCCAAYLTKIRFPFHSPAGQQAIFSIKKIPTNIPIVILHNKEDQCLSYFDALALYEGLVMTRTRETNIYLIPIGDNQGQNHVNLLNNKQHKEKIEALKAILRKHELPTNLDISIDPDLNPYQPEVTTPDYYDDLIHKENAIWYFDYVVKAGLFGLFLYIMYKTNTIPHLLRHLSTLSVLPI